ncbi:hypothetical protein Patl1_29117 [Pistacia atlantica]|uniref:Uncharacterized protein n=1 Tax=Pistacia atlantica TaxID=434234 RepID=A0ACC1BEV7_9ROSI|nr:hypothetical protein Patl1_29117 [Pistacia atlantica]
MWSLEFLKSPSLLATYSKAWRYAVVKSNSLLERDMFIETLTSVKGIDRNRFRDYLIYFKGKLIFWNWISSDLSKSLRQINCSFSFVNSL